MPGNFFLVLLILAFTSCDHEIPTDKAKADSTLSRLELVKLENLTPTVSIREYKLIVTGSEDRKSDANEILELKRKWPWSCSSQTGLDLIQYFPETLLLQEMDIC